MKFAVIENEILSRNHLVDIILQLRPQWQLVFTAETVEDSIAYFSGTPDAELLFLDIELDDGNCFDMLKAVHISIPVIFTTSYSEYALKAFTLCSIDYLLKPITLEAVNKAIVKLESLPKQLPRDYQAVASTMKSMQRSRVLISSGDTYSFVNLDDIAYFVSEDKYVFVCLLNGRKRMTEFRNLGKVMEEMPRDRFFQVSRNFVVSINAIEKVSKFFTGRLSVKLKGSTGNNSIVVSAARRKEFLDWLGGKE